MPDKCPICLEELRQSIGTIACGHCFHRECFNNLSNAHTNAIDSCLPSSKLPRCPVCKQKSKKFIALYITLDEREDSSGSCSDDATEAVRSLASENFQLQKTLRELQSLSKDQSDLLLEVLPKFDDLETKLDQTNEEKEMIEKELRDVEAENAELISDWNEVEMKMQLLKAEKNELKKHLKETKRENSDLSNRRDEVDQKLAKARKKKKRIESAWEEGFVEQERQAQELDFAKDQIIQSQTEKKQLTKLLEKSQSETSKLKRKVRKLKRLQKGKGSMAARNRIRCN